MKFVCYTTPTEKGLLLEYPSESIKAGILHQWNSGKDKYKGYMSVELKNPYKSRTTGKGSQNNKFYALITEICKETGNDLEDVKDAVKERAIKRGYPYSVNKITGQVRPYSTTRVNTVEMSYLIDEAMQLCAELGINPALDEASEKENYDIF